MLHLHTMMAMLQMNRSALRMLGYGVSLIVLASSAHAQQVAPQVAPRVDPGRLEQRFEAPSAPAPKVLAPLAVEETVQTAPEGSEQIRFVLSKLHVEGSSVYTPEEIETLYRDLLGTEISLSRVYDVANAITAKYRADGYILTTAIVPAQEVQNGTVRIAVVEGFVDEVNVEGAKELQDGMKNMVERILAMRPLNVKQLERYVLLMNDLHGVSVKSIMRPLGAGAPLGGIGLTLLVEKESSRTQFSLDNYGSRYLGPFQLGARHDLGVGAFDFDKLTLGGFVSVPFDELQYLFAGYEVPLDSEGTKLAVSLNSSWTQPGYTLEPQDVKGNSYGLELEVSHPYIRSRSENLYVSGAFDIRETENKILGTRLFRDRVRAVRLGTTYDFADNWRGTNLISAKFSQGLDILNTRESGSPDLSRAQGRTDFNKIEASLARLQALSDAWSVFAVASGQFSGSPLLSSEEFGYGGQVFGRAYDASEITGDSGYAASLELRYSGISPWSWGSTEPFLFYDIGKVYNLDNGVAEGRQSGASAGGGVRFLFDDSLTGTLTLATPLTRTVNTPTYGSNGSNSRVFFSLNYSM